MEEFKPTKIDLLTINGGKGKYNNGDGVQADTINALVEGVAFAQENGTDKTLTIENAPADAKAVGDKLNTKYDKVDGINFSKIFDLPAIDLNGENGSRVSCSKTDYIGSAFLDPYGLFVEDENDILHYGSDGIHKNSRTHYSFPDKSGTIALDKDITDLDTKFTLKTNTLQNALIQGEIISKATSDMTTDFQQTGGEKLSSVSIIDGSFATVNKIQGNTVKCENLLNIGNRTKATYDGNGPNTALRNLDESKYYVGLTANNYWYEYNVPNYSVSNDTVSGTGNSGGYGVAFPVRCLPNTRYSFAIKSYTANYTLSTFTENGEYIGNVHSHISSTDNFTTQSNAYWLLIVISRPDNGGNDFIASGLMLNKGSTALPYQPYFTGLKSAKISGIKSTGRNLIDIRELLPDTVANGIKFTANLDGSFNSSGTISSEGEFYGDKLKECYIPKGTTLALGTTYRQLTGVYPYFGIAFYDKDKNLIEAMIDSVITIQTDCYYLGFYVGHFPGAGTSNEYNDVKVMLNIGSTHLPFDVYTENVMTLPETYEMRLADSVANGYFTRATYVETLDVTNKTLKKTADNWQTDGWFCANIEMLTKRAASSEEQSFICTNFDKGNYAWCKNTFTANERYCVCGHNNRYFLCIVPNSLIGVSQDDTDEVKLAALKQWLIDNPPTVAYKTAEPISTEPITFTPEYIVYDKGSEQMLLEDKTAIPTITNEYMILLGGDE